MSGSLEVREFLMQQEGGSSRYGGGVVPSQRTGGAETSRVNDDQIRRARLAVARGALGVEDCAQLLDMLGLVPGEDGIAPVAR